MLEEVGRRAEMSDTVWLALRRLPAPLRRDRHVGIGARIQWAVVGFPAVDSVTGYVEGRDAVRRVLIELGMNPGDVSRAAGAPRTLGL